MKVHITMIDILKTIFLSPRVKQAFVGLLVAIVATVAALLGVEVVF